MPIKLLAIIITFSVAISAAAEDTIPSPLKMKEWWKNYYSTDKVNFYDPNGIKTIRLPKGEMAFLAPVEVPEATIGDAYKTALVRPEKEEARLLPRIAQQVNDVIYISKDNPSLVVTTSVASGQGFTEGVHYLIQFDEWEPKVVREFPFKSNLGDCGQNRVGVPCDCHEEDVEWFFKDVNQDYQHSKEIIELVIVNDGPDNKHLATTTQTNIYILEKDKLVKMTTNKALKAQP